MSRLAGSNWRSPSTNCFASALSALQYFRGYGIFRESGGRADGEGEEDEGGSGLRPVRRKYAMMPSDHMVGGEDLEGERGKKKGNFGKTEIDEF